MKIKVKIINPNCKFKASDKGEWIDLRSSINIKSPPPKVDVHRVIQFPKITIPLGFAMELPKYFEANILPRSSTYKNFGIILSNSMGVVDSSYKGDEDEWGFPGIGIDSVVIKEGDRIAQFRIRPSQFAPWWIKIKWLFTNNIEFVEVDSLNNKVRGGFGSTGIK